MTPLVLSLALTSPAQQPLVVSPPVVVQPRVVVQPQLAPLLTYRPPVYQTYPSVPVVPVAPQAVTLGEFSRFFTPTPGKHDVWVIHPTTRQPVKVCFTLPAGKLREFEVDRDSILFEFSHGYEVEIHFRKNGTVNVKYRD